MLEYIALITISNMPVDAKPRRPLPEEEYLQPQPLYINTRQRYSDYVIIENTGKPFTSLFHENPETFYNPQLQLNTKINNLHHHNKSAEELLRGVQEVELQKNKIAHNPHKKIYAQQVNYFQTSTRKKQSKKLRRKL